MSRYNNNQTMELISSFDTDVDTDICFTPNVDFPGFSREVASSHGNDSDDYDVAEIANWKVPKLKEDRDNYGDFHDIKKSRNVVAAVVEDRRSNSHHIWQNRAPHDPATDRNNGDRNQQQLFESNWVIDRLEERGRSAGRDEGQRTIRDSKYTSTKDDDNTCSKADSRVSVPQHTASATLREASLRRNPSIKGKKLTSNQPPNKLNSKADYKSSNRTIGARSSRSRPIIIDRDFHPDSTRHNPSTKFPTESPRYDRFPHLEENVRLTLSSESLTVTPIDQIAYSKPSSSSNKYAHNSTSHQEVAVREKTSHPTVQSKSVSHNQYGYGGDDIQLRTIAQPSLYREQELVRENVSSSIMSQENAEDDNYADSFDNDRYDTPPEKFSPIEYFNPAPIVSRESPKYSGKNRNTYLLPKLIQPQNVSRSEAPLFQYSHLPLKTTNRTSSNSYIKYAPNSIRPPSRIENYKLVVTQPRTTAETKKLVPNKYFRSNSERALNQHNSLAPVETPCEIMYSARGTGQVDADRKVIYCRDSDDSLNRKIGKSKSNKQGDSIGSRNPSSSRQKQSSYEGSPKALRTIKTNDDYDDKAFNRQRLDKSNKQFQRQNPEHYPALKTTVAKQNGWTNQSPKGDEQIQNNNESASNQQDVCYGTQFNNTIRIKCAKMKPECPNEHLNDQYKDKKKERYKEQYREQYKDSPRNVQSSQYPEQSQPLRSREGSSNIRRSIPDQQKQRKLEGMGSPTSVSTAQRIDENGQIFKIRCPSNVTNGAGVKNALNQTRETMLKVHCIRNSGNDPMVADKSTDSPRYADDMKTTVRPATPDTSTERQTLQETEGVKKPEETTAGEPSSGPTICNLPAGQPVIIICNSKGKPSDICSCFSCGMKGQAANACKPARNAKKPKKAKKDPGCGCKDPGCSCKAKSVQSHGVCKQCKRAVEKPRKCSKFRRWLCKKLCTKDACRPYAAHSCPSIVIECVPNSDGVVNKETHR